MNKLMTSWLTKTSQNSYQAVNGGEDAEYHEYEWQISKRAKQWLIAGAVVTSGLMIYLFCFVLPLVFIPKAYRLKGIVQVKNLDVLLRPVLAEFASRWTEISDYNEYQAENEYEEGNTERNIDVSERSDIASTVFRPKKPEVIQKDRLVVVGDIHGQQEELHRLLKKIRFDKKSDKLFVLGDFISKGPNSLEVIDDLIDLDAKCILGNHEFYVLQNYAAFHGLEEPEFVRYTLEKKKETKTNLYEITSGFNDDPEYLLAKKLQPHHVKYINLCPIIMSMGPVPLSLKKHERGHKSGHGLAVHAGLKWDLTRDLYEQNPIECLEMRAYLKPHFNETTSDADEANAVSWSKIWNQKHKDGVVEDDYVVYYGHDAHRGLNIKKWSKGLDSGCTKGGSLTAMIIWQELDNEEVLYKERLVSVKC